MFGTTKRNKSEYEKEFSETHTCVLTYKDIDIYEYFSDTTQCNCLTFWYSKTDSSKYITTIKDKESAIHRINSILKENNNDKS